MSKRIRLRRSRQGFWKGDFVTHAHGYTDSSSRSPNHFFFNNICIDICRDFYREICREKSTDICSDICRDFIQKSHLHIAVSIPLSSRDLIIQNTKMGGGGGGWWFKLNVT